VTPRQAIEALFAAWERLDVDAIAELFADDGVYEDPLVPESLTGRETIRAGLGPAVAELSDCRIETRQLVDEGGVGFVEGYFRSALAGDGGRLDFPFAAVVELRDGLIVRLTEYFDTRPFPMEGDS
jgi:ketosteroid isomerase-like protein